MPRSPLVFALSLTASIVVASPAFATDDPPTYADRAADEDDEDTPERRVAFLVNPLGAAIGVYGGEVDFVIARHVSIGVEAAIYRVGATTARALGGGVQLFPFRAALHGLYLYPRFAYARASTAIDDGTTFDSDVVGLGGTLGYQFTWDHGFTVRVGGGAMWFTDAAPSAKSDDPLQPRLALTGVRPVLDASLGWAF